MLVDLRSCAFFSLLLSQAFCNPEGFQLVLGDANSPSIDATGSLIIESGKNAVIQWDSFSIGERERVHFSQADSHSAVLNRVMGGSASSLLGSLDSNGQIILINPNGVLIGKDGLIQTAGFIASTADVSNEEFLKGGDLHFAADSSASIVNLGAIKCPTGDIVLLARTVQNSGTLTAPEGLVTLAAGAEILIKPDGDERIFIQPTESDFASVENSGDIHALAVEIKSGRSPYLYAIKSSGNISTPKFAEQNGRIYIVADTGRTDVSGALSSEGGEVRILGEEVVIDNPLAIDVSSAAEGGTVLIGGDYKGENPEIPSARMTYVGPNTSIKADARTAGNGGKVILWSTDKTGFYGNISAQGGTQGGNGGLVEVSGGYLDYQGYANTLATLGKTGELLLDPVNVTIQSNGGANTNGNFMQFDFVSITTMNTSTVDTSLLVAQLGTANVTISTAGTFLPTDNPGIITIASDPTNILTWAAATTLTLIANDQILLMPATGVAGNSVNLSNTNAGMTPFTAFSFQAGNGIFFGFNASNISTITTNTGDIVLHGIGKGAAVEGIYVGPSCFIKSTGLGNIRMYGVGGTNSALFGAFGIDLDTSATISTASGEIDMEGIGGTNSGTLNHGITLNAASSISTASSSQIRMKGTGNGISAIGIQLNGGATVSSSLGNIIMEGLGGNSTDVALDPCIGIQILGSISGPATQVFTAGSIKMIGIGGPPLSNTATGSSNGIQINDFTILNTQISTTAGSIHLIGRGAGTGANNNGILIFNNIITAPVILSSATASDGATIILEGYGSINAAATDSNIGVAIQNCRMGIQTVDSDVIITGHGGGSSVTTVGFNRGININSNPATPNPGSQFGATLIQATGVGNIVMSGFGGQAPQGAMTSLSDGVAIANTPVPSGSAPIGQTQLLTASGSIFINGESIGRASSGVTVTDLGTQIFPGGGGDLYINGTALGGAFSYGITGAEMNPNAGQATFQVEDGGSIYLNGSATQDTSLSTTGENIGVYFASPMGLSPNFLAVNGNITISGQGGVGNSFSPGVYLEGNSIQTNFGNITITGTAIATGTDNYGVGIGFSSTLATETPGPSTGQTGLISITGSGSVNGTDGAIGVNLGDTVSIATDSFDVVISGTGGGKLGTATAGRPIGSGNHGVIIFSAAALTTVNGNIDITGSAAGNGDFNSGVVLLFDVTNLNIASTGTTGGHLNITGTASQNPLAGSNNIGVDIAWDSGAIAVPIISTVNHNITITGTGSQTSVSGSNNFGVDLRFLNAVGTANILNIFSKTGSIEINGFGGSGSGGSGHGIYMQGVGPVAFPEINIFSNTMTPPPGNISLFGRGGTAPGSAGVLVGPFGFVVGQGSVQIFGDSNGTGSANYGVHVTTDSHVDVLDPMVGSFGQTLTIEGSGSNNSGGMGSNTGVLIDNGSLIFTTTKDISISGYGGIQGSGAGNNGLEIDSSNVLSTSGNFSLYGVGGLGGVGTIFQSATLTNTSGNISIDGLGGTGSAMSDNIGIDFVSSTLTTASGNISFYGVGIQGTFDNIGVQLSGGTISSTSGNMSFVGYGSLSPTGAGNDGILLTNTASVMNQSGNVFFYGAGGSGIGVDLNMGLVSTMSGEIAIEGYGGTGNTNVTGIEINNRMITTSGNLSFYGIGGTGTGSSPGINMHLGTITSTSGQMAFEGYGGSGGTGNHGVGVFGATITNTSGSISFYGVGGSGTNNHIGVDFDTSSSVTNGSGAISIEGFGAPAGTGTGNHGIAVQDASTITTALSTGTISLYGIGGAGTSANHGLAILNGTSAAIPSQVSSGTGDLSITAESGSGFDSFGLDLDTFAQILTTGGNMFLLGKSNANAAGMVGGIGIQMADDSLIQQTTSGGIANAVINIFARGSTQAGSTNNIGLNLLPAAGTAQISSGYSLILVAESGLSAGVATDAIHLGSNATITTNTGNFGNLDITTLSVDALGGNLTLASNSTISGGGSALSYMNFDIANNFNIGLASMAGAAQVQSTAGAMTVASKGNLTLAGGTGLNNFATLITTTGSLTVTTFGNISLTGGSGSTALAVMSTTTGPLNIRTIKNPLTGGGNVTLTGGIGPNASADISTASPTIGGIAGHIMTVGGNLTLTGGTGLNATAQIGSPVITINTDILFPFIGGNLTLNGDSNAIIGHGDPTLVAASILSGNLTFRQIGGSVTLTGNTNATSAGGLAQIGHIDQTAGGSTLSGNIFLNALGSITLTGGTQGTNSGARIGHGGQSGATTFGASTMSIFAGTTLFLTTPSVTSGVATITNPSSGGGLTLITDNLNPLNPAVGAGGLDIDNNSQLATTGGGQLRIYSAQQSTNTIPTGKVINGHAYTPALVPPAGIDTSYEIWNSYYGTHLYGGPEFTIFYKFPFLTLIAPCPPCPTPPPPIIVTLPFYKLLNEELVATMAQLSDMLPIWDNPFQNEYPYLGGAFYHGQVCTSTQGNNSQTDITGLIPPAGVDTSYEVRNSYFGTHVFRRGEFTLFYQFPFLALTNPCPFCPTPLPKAVPGPFYKLLNEDMAATLQLSDMVPIWDNPFGAFYQGQVCLSENMKDQELQTDRAEYLLESPYLNSDSYQCSPNFYQFRAVIFENEVY